MPRTNYLSQHTFTSGHISFRYSFNSILEVWLIDTNLPVFNVCSSMCLDTCVP